MNVKKFSASSTREALRKVRDALGADAVILSNRNVNGSVEILALASDDMSSLAPTVDQRPALLPTAEPSLAAFSTARRSETSRDHDQAAGLSEALGNARDNAQRAQQIQQPF